MRSSAKTMVGAVVLAIGVLVLGGVASAGNVQDEQPNEVDTYGSTPPNDVRVPTDDNPNSPLTPDNPPANPPANPPNSPDVQTDNVAPPVVEDSNTVRPLSQPSSSGGLPITGGDVVGLVLIGLAAIGVGTTLVVVRRRSADSAS